MTRSSLVSALVLSIAGSATHATPPASSAPNAVPVATTPARLLYVWTGDKDEKERDFLAVVDVDHSGDAIQI